MAVPSYAGFLQFDVVKGSASANLAKVQQGFSDLAPPQGSLVVLPELWGTGFDYPNLPQHADMTKELLSSLQKEAALYGICIAGSLPEMVEENGKQVYYNTLYFTGPDGLQGKYRKQHLFAPMRENLHFSAGTNPAPVPLADGFAAGLVCFDLRFPDLAVSSSGMGGDVLVVSAQWPSSRLRHWRILLQARAIENQIHVVASNRCGKTDGQEFAGHSMVIAPDGTILQEASQEETAMGCLLDGEKQNELRNTFNTVAPRPYRFHDRLKVKNLEEMTQAVTVFKKLGRKVVFTNGCFDILHQGHVTYLEEARRQGDFLIVGLNSDSSIRSIKGPDRPVNSQESRARVLAALGCVDGVVVFGEDTPIKLISTLLPDVLVKGADWAIDQIVGGPEVVAAGGRVANIPMVESFSTTGTIEKIKNG